MYKVLLLALLTYAPSWAASAADSLFRVTQLPPNGLILEEGWKYMPGDNPQWAKPEYDDRIWQPVNPTADIFKLKPLWQHNIGWFRLRLSVDSTLRGQSLALLIQQTGASEIYVNGKLILRLGRISSRPEEVQAQTLPANQLVALPLGSQAEQVIAIRFALQKGIPYIRFAGRSNPAVCLQLNEVSAAVRYIQANDVTAFEYFRTGLFFIFAVLHLAFFWYYPVQRANLYFFLFALLSALAAPVLNQAYKVHSVELKMYLLIFALAFGTITRAFFYLVAVYALLNHRKGTLFRLLAVGTLLVFPLNFLLYDYAGLLNHVFLVLVISFESIRIALMAVKRQQRGGRTIAAGGLGFLLCFSLFMGMVYGALPAGPNGVYGHLAFNFSYVCLPVAVSLVLARDFAYANRALGAKGLEVQLLSARNLQQEQEKRRLQELDEVKSRFFANLSHEFRTPLSLIRGTVEKLRKRDDPASERQLDYKSIDYSAAALLQMVNQLLDLSRLEAGKLALHPEPEEVSALLGRVAGSFASLFESKGIAYQYTAPLQAVWVLVDGPKLEQILSNLLSNAAKFTPAGGAVRFAASFEPLSPGQGGLRVVVEDTGIGIAAPALDRVFERFYQADSSATRSYQGSGIGLSLVKELVGLYGGEIKVASTPGAGTTFTVQIPLPLAAPGTKDSPGSADLPENTSLPTKPLPDTAQKNGSPGRALSRPARVLVVEDHAGLRQFISGALAEQYSVREAQNGQEGYQLAIEQLPDLIISDVMMPGMDGFTLCGKLKTDPRTAHIPLVLLTAKAGAESKLAGLETGADDYLTKPFGLEELLLRVRNLLESRRKLRQQYGRPVTPNPREITVASVDEQFLSRVLSVVEAHLGDDGFDVETFSQEVGMSRSQLHRKLTALTGQGPGDFIRTVRLKRAALLLQSQAGNVSDVAYQVGFTNLPHFSKAFREYFGKSPSGYARRKESSER